MKELNIEDLQQEAKEEGMELTFNKDDNLWELKIVNKVIKAVDIETLEKVMFNIKWY